MSVWPKPPDTISHAELVRLLNVKLPLIEQRGNTLPVAAASSGLTGMVDPTDYGYTVGATDEVAPATDSWAALSAAGYMLYSAVIDGVATGGSTTTLVDATETFAATLDDRIDAGAGNDFSHEIVWITGDNQGLLTHVDVRDSATQLTFDPAMPNAVAAGDQYRILKSARTQTRRAEKVLRIPPGRARIQEEVICFKGASALCIQGSGMGVSMLDFSNVTNIVNATTFNSSTATTLTKTGAGWVVNQFVGRFAWCWNDAGSRAILSAGKIVSNTSDTITVDHWAGATPVAASQTFAIGLRSALLLNGIGGGSFSEFQVYTGTTTEFLMKIAVHWMRPTYTPPAPEDICAFSSSQNMFTHVEGNGRSVFSSMHYGNLLWAANNQIDNGFFVGCRFWDEWVIGTSTDQRYSKSPAWIGDGTPGNSLICTFVGGAIFRGQHGLTVAWQDVLLLGTTVQSNGDTSMVDDAGQGLGDIYIQGISAYCGFYGVRSEGSSRFLSTSSASGIAQQITLEQCSFHIGGHPYFALDGQVIHSELHAALTLNGIWIYGDDPTTYATPRHAVCYHLLGVVRCEDVKCVGSAIHEFFIAGLSAPVQGGFYAELDSGNGYVKTWVGRWFLASTSTPAVAGNQWHWEGVMGTAPDVSHGRSSAGVYRYNEGLVAQVPHALGSSMSIPTDHTAYLGRRTTLTGSLRLTGAGTSRVIACG